MTGHTHRQKGRNVARLIPRRGTWGPRVSPRHAMQPRGGLSADLILTSTLAYASPSRPFPPRLFSPCAK